ncbi:MAG: hypothetical protein KAR21_20900, partial [Spirochaetales bacterium]|nr:hypothetical protein [Spirochaetales bacterium]
EKAKRVFIEIDLVKRISKQLHTQNTIHRTDDLKKEEVQQVIIERVRKEIASDHQLQLYKDDLEEHIIEAAGKVFEYAVTHEIKIPRIAIVPEEDFEVGFRDFNLDTSNLKYSEISEDLQEKVLTRNEGIKLLLKGGRHRAVGDLRDIIVNELINYNEIDYDEHADLLYKLAGQALASIKDGREQKAVDNIIWNRKKNIAEFIYTQMKPNFYLEAKGFKTEISTSFSEIRLHNMSKIAADIIHLYSETITPASRIKSCVFTGFKKSCHSKLKFDSKSEKDFAFILEEEANSPVLKWLRPAPRQFNIWWGVLNQKLYEPDFVAETEDAIYLIEVKAEKDMTSADVQDKAKAAIQYCKHATEYNAEHGEKPWKYILIPHDKISIQMGIITLVEQFEVSR